MKHDKQLRKTFDEAQVNDLVPDFDPDAGWEEVSRRLKPGRRRIALNRYLPYAVAVAAVLLLLVRQKENASFTLVAFRKDATPVQQPERQARPVLPPPDHSTLAAKPLTHPAALPAAPVVNPVPLPVDTGDRFIVVEASTVLKEALPVKHYADIAPVLPAAEELPVAGGQKKGFWRSRIARRRIAPQTGTKEEAPIRGLMYALNKE
ncbi:MAG: hypothetical protein JNL13_05140 [Chitinophagaceae bacterium]|nr:hypothetical protein [Chitinophagaceae bacterium]